MTTPPALLTVAQAAAHLRVSPGRCRELIARGDLRATRIGPRLYRITERDLDACSRARHKAAERVHAVSAERLTVAEAADMLGTKPWTVSNWIRKGILRGAVKVEGAWYLRRQDLARVGIPS